MLRQPFFRNNALLLLAFGWGGVAHAQAPVLTGTAPIPNTITQAVGAAVTATFGAAVLLPPDASQAMRVFSAQRGGQRAGNSGVVFYQPSGPSVFFTPNSFPFRAGETVGVSLTRAITSVTGQPLAPPQTYQFTTATGGTGRGDFRAGLSPVGIGNDRYALALADVDNDGDVDLVGSDWMNDQLVVQLNGNNSLGGGQGTFGPGTRINVPDGTQRLAVGDLDSDGDLDVLTCMGIAVAPVSVLLNDGTGGFALTAVLASIPSSVSAMVLGDVDGDGDLDLALSSFGNTLRIYRNNGAGAFAPSADVALPVAEEITSLALADADNDFDLDLVVAQRTGTSSDGALNVYRNGGDATGSNTGVFAATPGTFTSVALTPYPRALALGDLDSDGDLDAAVLLDGGSGGGSGSVVRLLNGSATGMGGGTGAGTFGAAVAVIATPRPQSLALADVDSDGDLDILAAGGSASPASQLMVNYNDGTAGFGPSRSGPAAARFSALAVADIDNDGDLDVLAGGLLARTVGVFFNGTGPEINVRAANGPAYPSGSTYNFGSIPAGTSTPSRLFYIKNLSPTDRLTLTDFVPAGAGLNYTIPAVPYGVAPGDSIFFSFQVFAAGAGVQTGSIAVLNNDADEASYVLNYSVTGIAAAAVKTWTGAFGNSWDFGGNWNPAGVPAAADDVLVPATARNPQVSPNGAIPFAAACARLTVQEGASVLLFAGAALAVDGPFDLRASNAGTGRFVMSGGTLDLGGDLLADNGFAATGGLVTLTGSARQHLGRDVYFWNLTVGPAGAVMDRNNVVVRRLLTLRGDFDTQNLGLFLRSEATGTAMVVNAGGRVVGPAYLERHIAGPNTGPGYRHLSAPIGLAAGSSLLSVLPPTAAVPAVFNPLYNTVGNTVRPFPTVFGFDESRLGAAGVPGPAGFDQGWYAPAGNATALLPGRGCTTWQPAGPAALVPLADFGNQPTFAGLLNTGPVAVGPLSRSGSGPFAGYHLLGNPYPSPISWDNVAKPAGLDDAVYVFRSTGPYTGFYDFRANGMGTLAGGEIAAMQGFFVRVSQPVPAFTFTDAARLTTYSNPTFRRGPADVRPTLALTLRPAAGSGPAAEADQAFIYFEAGATAAPDARFDALKLPNPGGLNLASRLGTADYALNGLPLLGAAPLVLPLTVQVPAAGRYELATAQLLNFGPGTALYLRDALLGTLTRLTPATRYGFTLAGTSAPGRFSVEFRPAGALASAAQVLEAQVQVWPNPAAAGAGVSVSAPAGASVTVLNALGQVLRPAAVADAAGTVRLPTAGLAAGLYVLRVRTGAGTVSRRLVIE